MKRVLKFIAFAIVFGLLSIWWLTRDAVQMVDAYLDALATGDHVSARQHLSSALPPAAVEQLLGLEGLAHNGGASWNSVKVNSGKTVLGGTVRTLDDGTIPIRVVVVEERGQKKLYALHVESMGAVEDVQASENTTAEPPLALSDEEQRLLAERILHVFAAGIAQGDLEALYASASERVRKTQTLEEFTQVYQSAFTHKDAILEILSTAPIMQELSVLDGGWLNIRGYYELSTVWVGFGCIVVYEADQWRMDVLGVVINAHAVDYERAAAAQ